MWNNTEKLYSIKQFKNMIFGTALLRNVGYISSKVPARPGPYDILIPCDSPTSAKAGLIYPSVVKVYWTAMIKRILVNRKLGEADKDLKEKVNQVLPRAFAI
jgi:hypothetical protein